MSKYSKTEQHEALERLRGWIKPGDTVHTILRSVSRSGMSREISVVLIDKDGDTRHPDHAVSRVIDASLSKQGINMGGCGMDMGFEIVYQLGSVLFPDGFTCTGEHCPSNDHSNGDRDRTPHHHASGGYALRHRWL